MADLDTDQAISEGQLRRHYGLSTTDLPSDFKFVNAFLAPSQGSLDYQQVRFIGLSARVKRLEGSSLRHLAGIAEMRHILGADRNVWVSLAAARRKPRMPDALWKTARGSVAIEYDIGSYSPKQIRDKAMDFRRYSDQLWGTSSRERARHLSHLLRQLSHRHTVHYAPWC